jgi:hypothetical protein
VVTRNQLAERLRVKAGGLRRTAQSAVGVDIEPRLLWIFGSPRSGSTWLLSLLGEHEQVVPINEPLIGMYLGANVADLAGVDVDALDSSTFNVRRLQCDNRNNFLAEEFSDVWLPALGDMMRGRFLAHAQRYPAGAQLSRTLVAIKEPNGSQSADVIMAALPRARLLFLLRDGRDVVDSELAANRPGAWLSKSFPGFAGIPDEQRLGFINRTAHSWLWRTEVVQQAFEAHPGPKRLIRYEDLRADTPMHLRALLEWLELDVDEARLAGLIERHAFEKLPAEARGEDSFARAASPGLWRENMSDEEQTLIERVIGAKLRELGYEA